MCKHLSLRPLGRDIILFVEANYLECSCTTCRMNSWSCAGHPGHIELPVPVYNVTFFDQLYRLIRAQCIYCHRLQMSRVQINAYVCKLRLLQYGLVDEVSVIESMESAGKKVPKKGEASSDEDEDDEDDLMTRRNAYVKRRIREAQSENKPVGLMTGAKNPVAAEKRRALIREFFKDIVAIKKCTSCSGYAIILQLSIFSLYRQDIMC